MTAMQEFRRLAQDAALSPAIQRLIAAPRGAEELCDAPGTRVACTLDGSVRKSGYGQTVRPPRKNEPAARQVS